jgi:hypothetical protein
MKIMWTSLLIVALMAWTVGCDKQTQPSGGSAATRSETPVSVAPATPVVAKGTAASAKIVLCGKCGQIKGKSSCCLKDAAVCTDCKLVKGSPGCCKITKGADVPLCAKCGNVEGAKACCDPKAVACEKCGLAKGAPGCCKIET